MDWSRTANANDIAVANIPRAVFVMKFSEIERLFRCRVPLAARICALINAARAVTEML